MFRIKILLCAVFISAVVTSCFHKNDEDPESGLAEENTTLPIYKNSAFLSYKPFVEFSKYSTYQGKSVILSVIKPIQNDIDISKIESHWEILTSDDVSVFEKVTDEPIKWVPENSGEFKINLTLKYDDEEVIIENRYIVLEKSNYDFNAGERLKEISDNFPGEWIGIANSPWNTPAFVDILFEDDGSFSSKALSTSYQYNSPYVNEIQTFYYISDTDSPFKQYEINDLLTDGTGIGELYDEDGNGPMQIKGLRYSADFNNLYFDVWNDEYGPIKLSLTRYIPSLEALDLVTLQESMIGKWFGSVETPWTLPFEVSFEFLSDGTYTSTAETPSTTGFQGEAHAYPALYYGSDEDSPFKTFNINNLAEDGKGEGEIDVWFDGDTINNGVLKNIELSQDEKFLKFEFWYRDEFGPLKYLLRRQ